MGGARATGKAAGLLGMGVPAPPPLACMLVPMHFALGIHASFTASWKPIILPALPIETEAQLSKDARELRT